MPPRSNDVAVLPTLGGYVGPTMCLGRGRSLSLSLSHAYLRAWALPEQQPVLHAMLVALNGVGLLAVMCLVVVEVFAGVLCPAGCPPPVGG